MRSYRFLGSLLAVCFLSLSCSPEAIPEESEISQQEPTNNDVPTPESPSQPQENMTIKITIGGKSFKADIEDTETGKAFIDRLPLTLDMSELNGNEKYCYGVALPRDDKYYNSIAAGDLMLYSGSCIVLFYGPAGGYSYTRIGKLASTEGLKEALGAGSVKVLFTSIHVTSE